MITDHAFQPLSALPMLDSCQKIIVGMKAVASLCRRPRAEHAEA